MWLNKRIFIMITVLLLALGGGWWFGLEREAPPIRVGVLHSLSGTMALSERPLVDMLRFAMEEINAGGGLNGRQVRPIVADCRSDWDWCAQEAERLIKQERVEVVFGCWTSACRKAVKPVFEAHDHLLFYPVQYEGMESSPNIVYTGAAPNQQIIPAVRWALDNGYQRFYLLGSDYVFPRTANRVIKDLLLASGGEVLSERYLPLGSTQIEAIIAEIVSFQPDMILNTINGDSNQAFFQALNEAGLTAEHTPVLSFSVAEPELAAMEPSHVQGHYAAWNYFQSLDNATNRDFVRRFQARHGEERVIGDPMEASYIAVRLWWQAVREGGTLQLDKIRNLVLRQSLRAPEGVVSVEPANAHLWKPVRVGKIHPNGQFEIVWESAHPVAPEPFPTYRPREQWRALFNQE